MPETALLRFWGVGLETHTLTFFTFLPTIFFCNDPYIDKGPMANPFRSSKKGEKLNPFKTAMVAHNADGNGNFTKLSYKASGYLESVNYSKTQPVGDRKLGFGTKDAFKSDEFTNAIRTSQHREAIVKEMTRAKESMANKTNEWNPSCGAHLDPSGTHSQALFLPPGACQSEAPDHRS